MKALIVEASRTQRLFFANILSEMGAKVEVSLSGEDALDLAAVNRFDLICISVVLPDMPGAELCSRLRAQPANKTTPLIMLNSGATDSAAECIVAGATDVFYKNDLQPFADYVARFLSSLQDRDFESGLMLYVEDSRSLSRVVIQMLSSQGYSVHHFETAEEAYDAYQQRSYDLLITDIILKGKMTGLRLVRTIREECGDKHLPILVMSEFGDPSRTVELYRAGANDYVSKPPLFAELRARVTNLIHSRQLFDQLQRRNAELSQLAIVDELTGLYNRRFLSEMAEKKIAAAASAGHTLSLAVLDIDHFKVINDNHGHAVGDQVLKQVAKAIVAESGDDSIAARIGGEEFVLLLNGTDAQQAAHRCDRIRQVISQLTPAGIEVTISIGVAEMAPDERFDPLFERADNALYDAKRSGRNKVCCAAEPALAEPL